MEEQTELQIKKIADFWLKFEFLKNFKKLGEKYALQIKKESDVPKENAVENRIR